MSLTIGTIQGSKDVPKSVTDITKDASSYEFDAVIPLKYWLRTADALIKQAQVYMREGDDEVTYFLLFRHAHLFLSNLSTHPEYKKNDPILKATERTVSQNLKALDVLRPRINRRYEEYRKAAQARTQRREEDAAKQRTVQISMQQGGHASAAREASAHLKGDEHTDIAAQLAGQEFSRRGSGRRAYPTGSSMKDNANDLAAQMQGIRNALDYKQDPFPSALDQQRQAYLDNNTGYKYPLVPTHRTERDQTPGRPSAFNKEATTVPVPPPKPIAVRDPGFASGPPRPDKVATPTTPSKVQSQPTYTFAPGAYLESGAPLRTIFLPPTLKTTFLRLAYQNTLKNVETCGFLAGTLRANALFVSALVVPKQTATSDTCEMTDESELFDYVDQHDLMILGWIHTHPTQTCFMSSRDLHTHSGYQMMLAESIAIVCAPSKGDISHGGDIGVYRLTDPPGKMAILQCDKPGIFHPHEVDNIYTDAMRPGHVMEISGMDFEIVDLR